MGCRGQQALFTVAHSGSVQAFVSLFCNETDRHCPNARLLSGDVSFTLMEKRSLVLLAAFNGNLPVLQWLVKNWECKCYGSCTFPEHTNFGLIDKNRIPFAAVKGGQLHVLKWLTTTKFFIDFKTNYQHQNVLHFAATFNQVHVMKWLVQEQNFDVDTKDGFKISALYLAVKENNFASMEWLLSSAGADPSVLGFLGNTILLTSIFNNNFKQVKWLLENGMSKVTEVNKHGKGCFWAAVWVGNLEILQYLVVVAKCDTTVRSGRDGWTGLILAVAANHPHIVDYLLENKLANINEMDDQNRGVLFHAVASTEPSLPLLRRLVNYGALVDQGSPTAVVEAVGRRWQDAACFFIAESGADTHQGCEPGETLLSSAAKAGLRDVVEALVAVEGMVISDLAIEQAATHHELEILNRFLDLRGETFHPNVVLPTGKNLWEVLNANGLPFALQGDHFTLTGTFQRLSLLATVPSWFSKVVAHVPHCIAVLERGAVLRKQLPVWTTKLKEHLRNECCLPEVLLKIVARCATPTRLDMFDQECVQFP
jgi:hypothetical protein